MIKALSPKIFLYACYLLLGLGLLTGCAGSRQLKLHRQTLKELAYGDYTPQEKLDVLGKELVILIDESLSKPTARGTYKHVDKFISQNQQELELLYQDINSWQTELSGPQKVLLGANLATKSYTRRFITLLPKFKKKATNKYKQIVFLSKIMNLFNPFKKND